MNEALCLLFLTEELNRAKDKGLKAGVVLNCVYGVNLVCAMLSVPRPGILSSVSLMTSSARLLCMLLWDLYCLAGGLN